MTNKLFFSLLIKTYGGEIMQESSLERVTVHTHLMNLSLQELKNSVDANDIITFMMISVHLALLNQF